MTDGKMKDLSIELRKPATTRDGLTASSVPCTLVLFTDKSASRRGCSGAREGKTHRFNYEYILQAITRITSGGVLHCLSTAYIYSRNRTRRSRNQLHSQQTSPGNKAFIYQISRVEPPLILGNF